MNTRRRIPHSAVAMLTILLLGSCARPPPAGPATRVADAATAPVPATASPAPALGAFAYVTVGTADLDGALRLWRDRFGLEIVARREGPDAALAELWQIAASAIRRQALLRTPGLATGGLHLVEFSRPGPPVRAGAAVFDRVPKNLDVYTRDLPARYAELQAAGLRFRSPPVEMPGPDGLRFREVQLPAQDDTNVVLLEVLDSDYRYSPAGYAGIGPLVLVVGDAGRESAFYREVLGLEPLTQDLLSGPDIERLVGLPPGAGLDFRVLGDPADPMGRIELVEYQGTGGTDRYPRARPPATGTLHAGWRVASLDPLREALGTRGVIYREAGELDLIFGRGPMLVFRTPAGFRVEVQGTGRP